MKITLSKSQWQFIGKKAGWMKQAQVASAIDQVVPQGDPQVTPQVVHETPVDVDISDFEMYEAAHARGGNEQTFELTATAGIYTYSVKGSISFEFEEGQNGGYMEPSWPSSVSLDKIKITSMEANIKKSDVPPPDYYANEVKDAVMDYVKVVAEKEADRLSEDAESYRRMSPAQRSRMYNEM